MESNYLIRLSANASSPVKTGIKLKQGDSGQTLSLTVEGINTASTTAKIAFKRPNGAVSVESSITAVNGVYNYTLQGNELGEIGLVVADLKFYEGTKRVSTASFIFEVLPDTMDGIHTPTAKVDKTLMEQYLDEMTVLNQQTASSASAAQASASIAQVAATQLTAASTGRLSNENLLDNPFFTVNQREGKIALKGTQLYTDPECTNAGGLIAARPAFTATRVSTGNYSIITSVGTTAYVKASDVVDGYVGGGYTVDRWSFSTAYNLSEIVTVTADGLRIQQVSTSPNQWQDIVQTLDVSALRGKTVTYSAITRGNNRSQLYAHIGSTFAKSIAFAQNNNWELHQITFTVPNDAQTMAFRVYADIDGTLGYTDIKAIKLELGSVSTLANDVAPNYADELARCQRYLYSWEGNYIVPTMSNGSLQGWLPFPVSMRARPVLVSKTYNTSNPEPSIVTYKDGILIYASGATVSPILTGFLVSADL